MSLTPSTMLALGTSAPAFSLPDTEGNQVTLESFKGNKGLLVLFICNHCPYVIHIREELAKLGIEYQKKGIGICAINSNDVSTHPDDSPDKMKDEVQSAGYTFPYLYDESQAVAHSYKAACTPDIFLFDAQQKLIYRGQIDDSRPGTGIPVSGRDLREALDALLNNQPISEIQKPSIGCNIKWKAGNEP